MVSDIMPLPLGLWFSANLHNKEFDARPNRAKGSVARDFHAEPTILLVVTQSKIFVRGAPM